MVYLYIDILPICFLDISDALNTAGPKIQAALCDCRPSLPEPAGLPDTEQACCLGMLGRQLAVVLLCIWLYKCLGTCITILVITFCEFADRLWSTISARMFFVVLGRHGHVPFGKVRGMISSALHTADGKAHGTRHMLELHCFYPPTCHSMNQYSDLWLCDTL